MLVIRAAPGDQLPDPGHPPGGVLGLSASEVDDGIHHHRIAHQPSIEHMFEYATTV
jgi:hypothetical protein